MYLRTKNELSKSKTLKLIVRQTNKQTPTKISLYHTAVRDGQKACNYCSSSPETMLSQRSTDLLTLVVVTVLFEAIAHHTDAIQAFFYRLVHSTLLLLYLPFMRTVLSKM